MSRAARVRRVWGGSHEWDPYAFYKPFRVPPVGARFIAPVVAGVLPVSLLPYPCFLAILAQVSLSVTARLTTSWPGRLSGSTQK